jgi:hypothetical protein
MRQYYVELRDDYDRRRYAYEVRADGANAAITRARVAHTRQFSAQLPALLITNRPAGVVSVG